MIFRIINKETKMFKRDDTRFNIDTEIALPVNAPKFGYNSKWVGTVLRMSDGTIGHWEDTRTQTELDLIKTTSENNASVQIAKQYLTDTDWIYAKCAEENLVTITEYPNIVAKRKESRLLIRSNK